MRRYTTYVPIEVKMFGVSYHYFAPSKIVVSARRPELKIYRVDIYNNGDGEDCWVMCLFWSQKKVNKYLEEHELVEL